MPDSVNNTPADYSTDPVLGNSETGFNSRKLIFSAATSVLIFVGGIMAGKWVLFGANYEAMISGLIGVLTIYLSSNVTAKYFVGKHMVGLAQAKNGSNPDPADQPKP